MGDLIHLISDIIKSDPNPNSTPDPKFGRGLRERFNLHPQDVMKEYDLTPEAQSALASMDKSEIICVIEQEFEDWQFPPNEFLAGVCTTAGEQGLYPDPQPRVYEIKVVANTGAQVQVQVTAQGLVPDATQFQVRPKSLGAPIPPNPILPAVTGTFRCGTFTATLTGLTSGTKYVPVVQIGVPGHDTSVLTMLDDVFFTA